MNSVLTLSLEQCQELLQDIHEKRRHRLTGSEYKAIIQAVDNHRVDRDVAQLARQVAAQLAQHEGPGSKPPFEDPTMNRVFMVESKLAMPAENDPGIANEQMQRRQETRARRSSAPRPA
jgi:hypothetical protein